MYSLSRRRLQAIADQSSGSSVGRKLAKGVVIGGLAGGVAGLAIEMTPDEYGLKKKTHEWIELIPKGKTPVQPTPGLKKVPTIIPPAQPVQPRDEPNEPSPAEEPKKPEPAPMEPGSVISEDETEPPPTEVPVAEWESDEEDLPVAKKVEQPEEPEPEAEIQESVPEVDAGDEAELEPVDEDKKKAEEALAQKLVEEEHEVLRLKAEVDELRSELTRMQSEHDNDMAKAAGATQATLATLDRLFNERETAISVARHGILVNEFLYSMALDKTSTSAGALRVDLENRLDGLVQDCFSPPREDSSFFKKLLGKVLSKVYSLHAGEGLLGLDVEGSRTWEKLKAVQKARAAVRKGNFHQAVIHMEQLHFSVNAQEWVLRAKQALQMWQGAEAAVASLHDDLSKVIQ